MALKPDGTLLVAERGSGLVREITPDGIIQTIAGLGDQGRGDGGPAMEAEFVEPHALALDRDGSLLVADDEDQRVRRIGTDGIISTVAGGGDAAPLDGARAVDVALHGATGIDVDDSGAFYIADLTGNQVFRVDTRGVLTVLAGTGEAGFSGDGGPADEAQLDGPHDITVAGDGSLYIVDEENLRVRRVDPSGIISTIAGSGEGRSEQAPVGDGGSALEATFVRPRVGFLHHDGTYWVADMDDARIRRISPPLPGYTNSTSWVAGADGSELYEFDTNGQHLQTVDAMTGVMRLQFGYTESGELATVVDTYGNTTQVVRDDDGELIGVESPCRATTRLELNTDGLLSAITNPADETTLLGYGVGGLLTSMTEPAYPKAPHEYEYDRLGRLTRDRSPSGRDQTLEAVRSQGRQVVTLKQNGKRAQTFERTLSGRAADDSRLITDPSGVERRINSTATRSIVETPTRTETRQFQGDPRFGGQSPYLSSATLKLSDSLTLTTTATRDAVLKDKDPFQPLELTTTTLINDQLAWVTHFDTATSTQTQTSPAGRVRITEFDDLGRLKRVTSASRGTVHYDYDKKGRLVSVEAPRGAWSYEYKGTRLPTRVTDPVGTAADIRYDAAERVVGMTLDGTELALGYTKNGALASVTPPGQPEHMMSYAPGNLLSSYEPPVEKPQTAEDFRTSYVYDDFGAIETIADPTGDELSFSYDKAGRVSGVKHSLDQVT